MTSHAALKTIVDFEKSPNTPEKQKIAESYMKNEIDSYEFFVQVSRYLESTKQ